MPKQFCESCKQWHEKDQPCTIETKKMSKMEIDPVKIMKNLGVFAVAIFVLVGSVVFGVHIGNKITMDNSSNVDVSLNGHSPQAYQDASALKISNTPGVDPKKEPTNSDIMKSIDDLSSYMKDKTKSEFENKIEQGQYTTNVQQEELNKKVDKILSKVDPDYGKDKINSADDLADKMSEHTGATKEECYRKISELEHDSRIKPSP